MRSAAAGVNGRPSSGARSTITNMAVGATAAPEDTVAAAAVTTVVTHATVRRGGAGVAAFDGG